MQIISMLGLTKYFVFDKKMSNIFYRIAQLDDVENVFQYEYKKLFNADSHEIENQIAVWNSHFRKEALEHYFKLGWSFLALNEKQELVGHFLGQPLLFLDKQTQTLWVEYISANTSEVYTELVDIAYRLAREKHLQRVLFSQEVEQAALTKIFPFQKWERLNSFLKTTK